MPRLLSREEFDELDRVGELGFNVQSWVTVIGPDWTGLHDEEMYARYKRYYLTRCTKLGKLLTGANE